ncbi:MAG: hydantoinase B/oxoprolinase family protein, partial [Firmicutes bacterium]|nr:hydantoinase B/oxoprolinase family protein [Bacillota bacterium]
MSERTAFTRTDPITAAVISGALESIAVEMGHKLTRMAYSSLIRESEDFGAAILDATGRQLAEATFSTPLQLGPIPGYMQGIFQLFDQRGDHFRPGDVILHNSAYYGATHGPDFGVCVPIFDNAEDLIGFAFTTAHHLDVGALTPGSCGIVDATDAYAEGLQFKAVKLYDRGVRQDYVWQLIGDNVRASALVMGDLQAQVSAARIGAERFKDLTNQYGLPTILAAAEDLMDYSEQRMRQAIAQLPDGTYAATGYIDGYLDDPNPARKDLPIAVAVTIQGSDIIVDLTGTAPQVSDRPINMPFKGTVDVSVYLTLRSILLDSFVTESVPQNEGISRPIQIIAPPGTLANPIFPAPTIARFCP